MTQIPLMLQYNITRITLIAPDFAGGNILVIYLDRELSVTRMTGVGVPLPRNIKNLAVLRDSYMRKKSKGAPLKAAFSYTLAVEHKDQFPMSLVIEDNQAIIYLTNGKNKLFPICSLTEIGGLHLYSIPERFQSIFTGIRLYNDF